MGGATTKIGDPSGKDESRKILNDAEIAKNIQSLSRMFTHELSQDTPILNNADWLDTLNYPAFLRDYGTHLRSTECLLLKACACALNGKIL